jgi:hypothetical protein
MDDGQNNHDMMDMTPRLIRPPSPLQVIDLTSDDEGSHHSGLQSRNSSPRTHAVHAVHSTLGAARRGPRFGAEIIDLTEDSSENQAHPLPLASVDVAAAAAHAGRLQSPDIQFMGGRQLPRRLPTPPPLPHRHTHIGVSISLDDEDDDIEITHSRPVHRNLHESDPLGGMRMNLNGGRIDLHRVLHRMLEEHNQERHYLGVLHNRLRMNAPARRDGQFVAPDIDFEVVGFDMGFDREDTASPPVQPLPPAPPGLTRSPVEGGICPNCGDELSEGDSDLKRQIWLAKCGHVSVIHYVFGFVSVTVFASFPNQISSSISLPKLEVSGSHKSRATQTLRAY